jgi:hypothetical protein
MIARGQRSTHIGTLSPQKCAQTTKNCTAQCTAVLPGQYTARESNRETKETADYGEVLRWSTESGDDELPHEKTHSVQQETVDSEEPTEFGLVYDRYIMKETANCETEPSAVALNILTG